MGTTISFSGDTKLLSDFKDFLGNSENKTNLNQLLVKCFIEEHTNNIQTFVVTFNDTVLSNQQCLYDDEDISNCSIEEADQRLVRHAYNCIRNEISSIVISTNDTDVIMLLIANFPIMLNINCGIKLYCLFRLSDNKKTFFINELAAQIGFEKCKGLSFFHTFTGCDTVSSFFKQSKAKFLKCWLSNKYEELTGVFQELSNLPVEVNDKQLDTLSEFVKDVYFPKRKKSNKSLNELRQEMFLALPNMDLRLLPPSKKGLYKHVQRTSIQAGWINRECIGNVLAQEPEHWGWKRENNTFFPEWQNKDDLDIDINFVTITCTCTTALCKNCKCAKNEMKCLPFCSCRGNCETPEVVDKDSLDSH